MELPVNKIICGDCRKVLREIFPDESIDMCVTSPPYWGLRDYGVDGQLGLEKTIEEYIAKMVEVFREVKRVLKPAGTLWLNMGDTYNSGTAGSRDVQRWPKQTRNDHVPDKKYPAGTLKHKDLCFVPERLAMALQADGWWVRSEIIWHKPNPMPESCTDRPTKAHEKLYLLTKSGSPLYWTNNRLQCGISTQPPGTQGIEGQDWEWVEHSACKGKGCDNKRCVKGKIKSSLWDGHDYYYDAEAIKEDAVETNTARPRMGQGQNTQYSQKRSDNFRNSATYLDHNSEKYTNTRKDFEKSQSGGGTNVVNHSGNSMGVGGKKNKRTVWTIPTEACPDAHFATFPRRLIEPCILAGTSEKGCCSKCGKAWERITEQTKIVRSDTYDGKNKDQDKNYSHKRIQMMVKAGREAGYDHDSPIPPTKTIGWRPTCKCKAETVPGIVLDPFMGSGTTAVVAYEHGRDYVGIELNPKYVELAEKRIGARKDNYSLLEC